MPCRFRYEEREAPNRFTCASGAYTHVLCETVVFILQVTNMLYEKLALYLTELENHRTETAYEDSLIAKTFMFQFVNSYASLIYIAFVKQHLEGCAPDCMTELGTTLGTIFITR